MALQYLLLAFLAFHGTTMATKMEAVPKVGLTAPNSHQLEEVMQRSLEEELQKLIEQLKQILREALDAIVDAAKQIWDQLTEELKEIVALALAELKKVVEKAVGEIKDLLALAQELGEDAVLCVTSQQERVQELFKAAQEANKVCENNVKDEAVFILQRPGEIIAVAKANIEQIIADFKACDNIVCYAEVLTKAQEEYNRLIADIEQYFVEISQFFTVALPEAQKCVDANVSHTTEEIKKVVADIRTCMNAIE